MENSEWVRQLFPWLFARVTGREGGDYPSNLLKALSACAPPACKGTPTVAVLTPGIHNSAYFEHSFLADQMGAELVEGHDLRVVTGRIAMRTTQGYRSEEHTSELQSLMRISYAVFCLKKKKNDKYIRPRQEQRVYNKKP